MRAVRCGGLVALLLGRVAFAGTALAAPSWDGTWTGGWEKGNGVQIIVAGDKVTGVYRDGDYPEILSSEVSPEGGMLVLWWVGGDALLRRIGDREAGISLRERGRPARAFTVKRE
jgi:hypothetical protein